MAGTSTRRGGPLIALGAVLGLWIAARVVLIGLGGPSAHAEMPASAFADLDGSTQVSRPAAAVPSQEETGQAAQDETTTGDTASPGPVFAPPPAYRFEPFGGPHR